MRLFAAAFLIASTSLASQAAVSVVGGPIYYPVNGHNYYVLSPGTWFEAEAFAQTLGGHLVAINDPAENSWIWNNVNIGTGTYLNPYIGLNDSDANGVWTWSTGEPASYFNWAPGEPNFLGSGHYYGNLMGTPYPEQWNNTHYSDVLFAIAEVPEPSTLSLALLSGLSVAFAHWRRR